MISLVCSSISCTLEFIWLVTLFTVNLWGSTASCLVCLLLYEIDLREPDYQVVTPLHFIRSLHLTQSTITLIGRVRSYCVVCRLFFKKDWSLEKWSPSGTLVCFSISCSFEFIWLVALFTILLTSIHDRFTRAILPGCDTAALYTVITRNPVYYCLDQPSYVKLCRLSFVF